MLCDIGHIVPIVQNRRSSMHMARRTARLGLLVIVGALASGCGINNIPTYDEGVKAAAFICSIALSDKVRLLCTDLAS